MEVLIIGGIIILFFAIIFCDNMTDANYLEALFLSLSIILLILYSIIGE